MSERKWKTLAHAYWLSLGSKGAEIAYFLLLVSLLKKGEMGLFNTLMSLTLFLLTLLDFGLSQATLREVSQNTIDVRRLVYRSVPVRGLTTLLALFVLGGVHTLGFVSVLQAQVLAILAVFQFFNALQTVMIAGLQGHGLQTRANQLLSAEAVVKLAALALLHWVSSAVDILSVVAALMSIKLAFSAVTWRALPPSSEVVSAASSTEGGLFNPLLLQGQIGFLWIAMFTILQNRLDWLMVSAFMDSSSVASYSVVNRYYEIALFVLGIGFTTIYPWLCRVASTRHQDQTLQLLRQLQYLPVPLVVAIGVTAFPLIDGLFWYGRYADALTAVGMLLPCAGLAVGNMMIYYDLMAQRHEKTLLQLCMVSTALQAIFNAWAIPRFGINGAIAGMWLMNVVNLLLFSQVARRYLYSLREVMFTALTAISISVFLIFATQLLSATQQLTLVVLATAAAAWCVWLSKARALILRTEGLR